MNVDWIKLKTLSLLNHKLSVAERLSTRIVQQRQLATSTRSMRTNGCPLKIKDRHKNISEVSKLQHYLSPRSHQSENSSNRRGSSSERGAEALSPGALLAKCARHLPSRDCTPHTSAASHLCAELWGCNGWVVRACRPWHWHHSKKQPTHIPRRNISLVDNNSMFSRVVGVFVSRSCRLNVLRQQSLQSWSLTTQSMSRSSHLFSQYCRFQTLWEKFITERSRVFRYIYFLKICLSQTSRLSSLKPRGVQ